MKFITYNWIELNDYDSEAEPIEWKKLNTKGETTCGLWAMCLHGPGDVLFTVYVKQETEEVADARGMMKYPGCSKLTSSSSLL